MIILQCGICRQAFFLKELSDDNLPPCLILEAFIENKFESVIQSGLEAVKKRPSRSWLQENETLSAGLQYFDNLAFL